MLCFTTDDFDYNPETRTFAQESSMFREVMPIPLWNSSVKHPVETQIKIMNPKTGNGRVFTFAYVDISNGEVCGWNYKYDDINLLIIND